LPFESSSSPSKNIFQKNDINETYKTCGIC